MNKLSILALLSIATSAIAHFNVNFYNQPSINHHTLKSADGGSISFNVLSGRAKKAYNHDRKKVTLLDTFGQHNLSFAGIVQDDTNTLRTLAVSPTANAAWNFLDAMTQEVITALRNGTSLGTYGEVEFAATFSCTQGSITLTTPSHNNFYGQVSIPFLQARFSPVTLADLTDLTPTTGNNGFHKGNANWTNFLASGPSILQYYNLTSTQYTSGGIADIEVTLHYLHECNDKYQADLQAGLVLPTGKHKNENSIFSLPVGYDGHVGFKLGGALEAECKWFSLAGSVDATVFTSHTQLMRIKTYEGQNGFLFLARNKTRRKKYPVVNAEVHVIRDCSVGYGSISLGYLFNYAGKSTLSFPDTTFADGNNFNVAIANTDRRLESWYRHSIQGSVSLALDRKKNHVGGQIGFMFTIPLAGKNIFSTRGYGVEAGLTYTCEI